MKKNFFSHSLLDYNECNCGFWIKNYTLYCPNCGLYKPYKKILKKRLVKGEFFITTLTTSLLAIIGYGVGSDINLEIGGKLGAFIGIISSLLV